MLEVENLSVSIGGMQLLRDISFTLKPGRWLMVAGPNGAGKSTLIDAVTRKAAHTGRVLLDGRDTRQLPPREFALAVGVLAQNHPVNYAFTVEEVVMLGRYPHAPGIFSRRGDEDARLVEQALRDTGLWAQRNQSVLTLSGGELQRTFLAQLFAQDPRILLLDEPSNHLDIQYQAQLFSLIERWLAAGGRSVLSVVHDLSLAKLYGEQALLLEHGRAVAYGDKQTVFTPENLNPVYRMDVFAWMEKLHRQWERQEAPR